jgi:phage-related protein
MPILAYALDVTNRPEKRASGQVETSPDEKEVFWWPENLTDEIIKDWPEPMRKEGGLQLGRVQQGLDPNHFRPMPSIGIGVREIKLQDEDKSQYRLIYIASFLEGIYVIHVISRKTTEQTSPREIAIAKKRLKEVIEKRKSTQKPA